MNKEDRQKLLDHIGRIQHKIVDTAEAIVDTVEAAAPGREVRAPDAPLNFYRIPPRPMNNFMQAFRRAGIRGS